MMMNVKHVFFLYLLSCISTVVFPLSPSMCDFNIRILNLNGARADFKRAALFKLMEIRKLDVMFLQETHSTTDIECDWRRAFNGEVILSHKSSLSGGVGGLICQEFFTSFF